MYFYEHNIYVLIFKSDIDKHFRVISILLWFFKNLENVIYLKTKNWYSFNTEREKEIITFKIMKKYKIMYTKIIILIYFQNEKNYLVFK